MRIGETLAAARQGAGLTVAEISTRTRIRPEIIEAIEQDDFRLSGGNFYARAQLRGIAQAVDVDPGPLIDAFDQEHGWPAGGPPARPPGMSTLRGRIWKLTQRFSPGWGVAMALPLAAFAGYALYTHNGGLHGHPDTGAAVRRTPSHSASPNVAYQAAAARPNVEVRLYAKGTSQVTVRDAAGKLVFKGEVPARSRRAWTGRKRLSLTLGNAGATQLTVNGRNLGTPGRRGQAMRLSFGPGDPRKAKPSKTPTSFGPSDRRKVRPSKTPTPAHR